MREDPEHAERRAGGGDARSTTIISIELLEQSFFEVEETAAPGVDRLTSKKTLTSAPCTTVWTYGRIALKMRGSS
jgi:hypothetical protein